MNKTWSKSDVFMTVFSIITLLIFSIISNNGILELIAGISGCLGVITMGKGKPYSYIFGFM